MWLIDTRIRDDVEINDSGIAICCVNIWELIPVEKKITPMKMHVMRTLKRVLDNERPETLYSVLNVAQTFRLEDRHIEAPNSTRDVVPSFPMLLDTELSHVAQA